MRVFMAIEFSEGTKTKLLKIQDMVRRHSAKGNFTRRENFHLTLRFIGDVSIDELEGLKKAVDRTVSGQKRFMLVFNQLGEFPRGNKRIIWLGAPGTEEAEQLNHELEMYLEELGYPREGKPFVPHITIGREVMLKEGFYNMESEMAVEPVEIAVSKISLMESTRLNGKLTYICLYSRGFA